MNSVFSVSKTKTVGDLIKGRTEVYAELVDAVIWAMAVHMKERHVRAMGVIDRSGKLVGVISYSDIVKKVIVEDLNPLKLYVDNIMSTNLISVREETSVINCLNMMLEHDINHLVVFGKNDKFLGLISRKDIDRACLEQLEEYAKVLHDYVSQA